MQIFSVELGWLPTVGADTWKHYILPSMTLGAAGLMAAYSTSTTKLIRINSSEKSRTSA